MYCCRQMFDHSTKLARTSGTVALFAVGALGFLSWLSASPARAGELCETEVVYNYRKPLERLPELRQIPSHGKLPFGPAGLFLAGRDQGSLMPLAETDIGFTLVRERSASVEARRKRRFNWLVTAKLARLNTDGQVSALGWRQKHLTSLRTGRKVPFRLPFPGEMGLYRLEIVFRDGAGKRLGRFGEYFRLLHPTKPNRRLTLNGDSFLPGETVTARAAEISFGWLALHDTNSIEINDGTTWKTAPINPSQLSLLVAYLIGPGEATAEPCWKFSIPSDASPGLYRFVVKGESLGVDGRLLVPNADLRLTSEFEIVAPP